MENLCTHAKPGMGNSTSRQQISRQHINYAIDNLERPHNVDSLLEAYRRFLFPQRLDDRVFAKKRNDDANYEQSRIECCEISSPDKTFKLSDVKTVNDVKVKLESRCNSWSVVNIEDGIIYGDDEDLSRIQKPLQIMHRKKERISRDQLADKNVEDVFYIDDDVLAQMECFHYANPAALVDYLESELCEKHSTEFRCPSPTCQKPWSMTTLLEKADLTQDELIFFQAVFDKNHVDKSDIVKCPRCNFFCSRKDENNAILRCSYCERNSDKTDFCFKCGSEFSSGHTCADLVELQDILDNAELKNIGENKDVPSMRLCPNPSCKAVIEHKSDCKQMVCPRCNTDFCFVCLTINENKKLKCSSWFEKCQTHPIQKVI